MSKQIFVAILVAMATLAAPAFSKPPRSTAISSFVGTWIRDDGKETVTIALTGSEAVISYTGGIPPARGAMEGSRLAFKGVTSAPDGSLLKETGSFEVRRSGLFKYWAIYYPNGKIDTGSYDYQRK